MPTVKEIALEIVREMPEDVTMDDIMEAFYTIAEIDKGLKEFDEDKSITLEEAKKKLSKWFKQG